MCALSSYWALVYVAVECSIPLLQRDIVSFNLCSKFRSFVILNAGGSTLLTYIHLEREGEGDGDGERGLCCHPLVVVFSTNLA